jgi:hypothetical protein
MFKTPSTRAKIIADETSKCTPGRILVKDRPLWQ